MRGALHCGAKYAASGRDDGVGGCGRTRTSKGKTNAGAGDLYWSLALLTAWRAGVSCAWTRKINGQKRSARLEAAEI